MPAYKKLNENEIEELLKKRSFYWCDGRGVNLVTNKGNGKWYECFWDGGGAVGIIKDADIKDSIIRCGYKVQVED